MTETTPTSTEALRFVHLSSPRHLLGAPLPARLEQALPAKQRRDHEKLAARVDEAGREIRRLKDANRRASGGDSSSPTRRA